MNNSRKFLPSVAKTYWASNRPQGFTNEKTSAEIIHIFGLNRILPMTRIEKFEPINVSLQCRRIFSPSEPAKRYTLEIALSRTALLLTLTFALIMSENAHSLTHNLQHQNCRHEEFQTSCYGNDSIVNASDRVYKRSEFQFKTYKYSGATRGFYSNQIESETCNITVDHVVSLKDAFDSGARSFSLDKKKDFANDKSNHVPACKHVNSSKANLVPYDWFQRSTDGKGVEVNWNEAAFCNYLFIYFSIKQKWELSFKNNNEQIFLRCGLQF